MLRAIRLCELILFMVFFGLFLAACREDSADSAASTGLIAGDAARGELLYQHTVIGAASAPGCITCHSLDADITLVGPSHAGIGSRAGSAVAGQSAEEYLKESIIDVEAHVTAGFKNGVMYPNYGRDLSKQEIADLVAFLLTLK